MNSLFVIGNGFDLDHGLKSSYENFRQYLLEKYPNASFDGNTIPESRMMPDGEEKYEHVDVVGFLVEVISRVEPNGDKWSDLETSIGFLDLDEFFDNWSIDDSEDDNPYHEVYRNQDLAANLAGAILKITDYFSDWINKIDVVQQHPKSSFEKLIDTDHDFFLTFNYTKTLEILYKAKNVCHIHGKQGEELVFGHGNDRDYTDDFMSSHIGSEDSLLDMQSRLRKRTDMALSRNQYFFDSLSSSVNKIFSYGFSFSTVDEVYIQEICRQIPTEDVTWYLNGFDDIEKRMKYKEVIRSCGFRGKFRTYDIS